VGNDIDIVTDSSPPQEVSPGLMHMGDGSFWIHSTWWHDW
jgi:hypothetical protein